MKFVSNYIKIFLLYSLFSFSEIISLDFSYPSAISLPDGNIFIVEKRGIFVYDEKLINIIYNYPFEVNEKINDENSLSNIIIKFKQNYIICLINLKIYFFDSEGQLLLKTNNIIDDEIISFPILAPIDLNIDNFYFYVIGYFFYENESYKLKIKAYKINLLENNNAYVDEVKLDEFISSTFSNNRNFANKGLACEYMQHNDEINDNLLVCFFIFEKTSSISLSHHFFDITNNSISQNTYYTYDYKDDLNDVKQIQMITNSNRKNALICVLYTDGNLECFTFYYPGGFWGDSGHFDKTIETGFICRNELYGMKLNYFLENQTISLSCIDPVSTVQVIIFDDNLIKKNIYEQFTNCSSIYGHSIIISKNNSVYFIISDVICDNVKRCFEPLIGSLSPIQIIDNNIQSQIPELEFSFEEEEIEGTIIEEENEEIKKEEEIGIEEEKSEEEINEELYTEEKTDLIEKKFDCTNLEKCKECDKESLENNLCINCNHEKNYYYLNEFITEPRNKYIDCVNELTKPSNFYFNKNNLDYEPCYLTCASCEYGGNSKENNCTSCDGVYFIKNPEEEYSSNCLIKCKYFYYIENKKYKCSENPFCPDEYKYVIKNKSKCVNNCQNDNEYKYRFNGECFKECPNNTKDDDDFICKEIQNNKCFLTENDINFLDENTTFYEIENLVVKYIEEFFYTKDHVSIYKNDIFTLTIYINNKCIFELGLNLPEIDFGSCYDKIIKSEKVQNSEIIVAIIDKKIDSKARKILKYGMFSNITGKYLDTEEICKEDKITIKDSINDKLLESGVNIDIVKYFFNDGVDVFNISSPFYNDICYHYN